MPIILDVETSGLDPKANSILSLGCIDHATGDEFYMECCPWVGAVVEQKALDVNGFTEKSWADKNTEAVLIKTFAKWLAGREDLTPVGQNVSFDVGFVHEACSRARIYIDIGRRTIDLHALCWFVLTRRGNPVPTKRRRSALDLDLQLELFEVKKRNDKTHSALEDVRLEHDLFKTLLTKRKKK